MSTDPRQAFPKRLRFLIRRGKRLAFAREHGFDKGQLSKLLGADEVNVTLETVWRFAQLLGVDPGALISDQETALPAVVETASEYDSRGTDGLTRLTTELRGIRLELRRIRKILEGGK